MTHAVADWIKSNRLVLSISKTNFALFISRLEPYKSLNQNLIVSTPKKFNGQILTVLCKSNAKEIRRNSFFVLATFLRKVVKFMKDVLKVSKQKIS